MGGPAVPPLDPQQRAEALERAVALAPDHIDANYQLARAYQFLGRAADAKRQLDRVEAIKKVAPPPPPGKMGPST